MILLTFTPTYFFSFLYSNKIWKKRKDECCVKTNYIKSKAVFLDLQYFAAEDEGRTEEPSETKLRKAREEGRVAKSQEINGALVLLLPIVCLICIAPWFFENCVKILRFYFDRCATMSITDPKLFTVFLNFFTKMILPIAITAMIAGIVGNVIQNKGFLFTTKTIEPKFSKILPKFGEYFKKTLFSFEGVFNIFKSLFKVVIVFIISWTIIKNELPTLLSLMNVSLWSGIVYLANMAAKLIVMAAVFFLGVSIPDYLVQRRQFMESMKMTKQEVKEEYKSEEGDPLIKSRLKQYMREMMSRNVRENVIKSDVVITNPTHFAVAVQYDKEIMPGPMVMAKGADDMAQRIKQIARENNVEIIENRPLARALYAEVEIGDIIPEIYYQALAKILAHVYNIKK